MSIARDKGFILWSQNVDPRLPDYIFQTSAEPDRFRVLSPQSRRKWYGACAATWAERSRAVEQADSWWISRSRSFTYGELTASVDEQNEAVVTVFAPPRSPGPQVLVSALQELARRMDASVNEREAFAFAAALVNLADGGRSLQPHALAFTDGGRGRDSSSE